MICTALNNNARCNNPLINEINGKQKIIYKIMSKNRRYSAYIAITDIINNVNQSNIIKVNNMHYISPLLHYSYTNNNFKNNK